MSAPPQALRIGVVVRTFPVLSETFILDHINGLLDRGHQVQVLRREAGELGRQHGDFDLARLAPNLTTWIPPGGRLKRAVNKARLLPRFPLGSAPHLLTGPWRADLLPLAATLRALKSPPALLHAHFGWQGEMVAQLKTRLALPTPLVVSVHGFDVNRALAGAAPRFPQALQAADRVIVTSRFMRRQTVALGCADERIVQIPIGIHVDRFKWAPRRWQPHEELRLLSIARLVEQKGIARGIAAAAALVRDGLRVRYTIVGDGPERAALERMARDCGIADFVHFAGPLPREAVQSHYADHHVFLFPCTLVTSGDEEGQGIVLQEAQACGLPVLTTLHGGIPDSVDAPHSAHIVADEPAAVIQGLRDLVAAAPQWPEMGQAGRRFVEQHFRHAQHIDRLEALYRDVLDKQSSQAGAR